MTSAAWAVRVRGCGDFAAFFRERMQRVRAACEAAAGADAERIWAEGTRLGVDEAIALAFATARAIAAAASRSCGLSGARRATRPSARDVGGVGRLAQAQRAL